MKTLPPVALGTWSWGRRPMLNEHYDVTTAAYAVGYESYPISVGNIRGCLESHPREILPG